MTGMEASYISPPATASQRGMWFGASVSRDKQSRDAAGGVLHAFIASLGGVSLVTWVGEREQIELVAQWDWYF